MRLLQQERQAVFQDAFQSDLKYYKEVGKIPSKSHCQLSKVSTQNKKKFNRKLFLMNFHHLQKLKLNIKQLNKH